MKAPDSKPMGTAVAMGTAARRNASGAEKDGNPPRVDSPPPVPASEEQQEAARIASKSHTVARGEVSNTHDSRPPLRGDGKLSPLTVHASQLRALEGAEPIYLPRVVTARSVVATPRIPISEPIPDINYARNVAIQGVTVLRPTSPEALQAIVREQPFVRALGRGHSFNHILKPDVGGKTGAIVDMRALNAAEIHDGPAPSDKYAWVEAGITIEDLNARLAARGLELRTAPMVKEVTVGGALATGSHGVGQGVSNFGDEVLAMEVLDGRGKVHLVESPEALAAHRVALGSMGVIQRVKLQAQDIRPMRTNEHRVDEAHLRARYLDLMATSGRADMFLFVGDRPGEGKGLLRVSDYVAAGEPLHLAKDNKPSKLVNHLEEHVAGSAFASLLLATSSAAEEWFGKNVGDFVRESVARFSNLGLRERKFTEASHALNHRFPGHTRVETAQWAVPKENFGAALDAIYAALAETKHELNMPVYIRNLRGTEGTLLGVNQGRDSVMLEVYSFHTDKTPVEFYRTLEKKMAALKGRPHLAKLMWDGPADLYDKDQLAHFQAMREKFDPTGKFSNDWTRGFFFSKKDAEAALPAVDFLKPTTDLASAPLLEKLLAVDPAQAKLVASLQSARSDANRLAKLVKAGRPTPVLVEEAKNQAERLSELAADLGSAKASFMARAGNGTLSPREVFEKSDVPVRAIDGLVNDFARIVEAFPTVSTSGTPRDLGLQVMNDLARALHGEPVMVLRDHDGSFALWSRTDPTAPAKVASLPTNADLSSYAVRAKSTAGAPPALGSAAGDNVPLAQSPMLAHFGRALGTTANATAGDFMRKRKLEFATRPDPKDALAETRAPQDQATLQNPVELSVMTYNVALLDVKPYQRQLNHLVSESLSDRLANGLGQLLGAKLQSPNLDKRREVLPDRIFSTGRDVILLQEVWNPEDVVRFSDAAKDRGYIAFVGPRTQHPDGDKGYNDGLMTFIKRSVIEEGTPIGEHKRAYTEQDAQEGRVGSVKRGYQKVSFTHKTLGAVSLFNTHLQAYPDKWRERRAQTRELGLAMSGAKDDGLVVAGGDLNAGPYYAHDSHSTGRFSGVSGYHANAMSHFALLHYSGASDAALMGRPVEDVQRDISSMHEETPRFGWPHTATETNGLYRGQYDEISSSRTDGVRMDHILGIGSFQAKDTKLLFTEVDPRAGTELSDHYGVGTTIVAERRVPSPRTVP